MRFSLLGPLRVFRGQIEVGPGQPRQRAVLASLLLRGGAPVDLPELVDDVWGEDAPSSAVGSIRTYIYRLRQMLGKEGAGRLRLVGGGYSLAFEPDALDLNRFRRLMSEARAARGAGDLDAAATGFARATGLWRGAALSGVPGPHAEVQRGALSELWLASIEERLACDVERGLYVEAAAELSALVRAHPSRERFCELLMTALHGAGRQTEALAAFHTVSHRLQQQLGVGPSANLRRLHELILTDGLTAAPAHDRNRAPGGRRGEPAIRSQLPADLPHLTGREEELDWMEYLIDRRSSARTMVTIVLGGMAGVGKTALAVRLAHRLADRFPDGQLYADLRGFGFGGDAREPTSVLADFLVSLGIRQESIPAGVRARSALFRELVADRRLLVVLDDARSSEQVRDLLPGASGCAVIVTSRRHLPALVTTHQAVPVTLAPLGNAEARSMLAQRLGGSRAAAEPAAADEIVRLCGGLPLALAVLGARTAYRPALSLNDILCALRSGPSRFDALGRDCEPGTSVRAALARSYDALDARAQGLFRLLGTHPGPAFTATSAAALAALPLKETRDLLDRLSAAHMVAESRTDRYHLHELLRVYALELAVEHEPESIRTTALRQLAHHYLYVATELNSAAAGAAAAWLATEAETLADLDRRLRESHHQDMADRLDKALGKLRGPAGPHPGAPGAPPPGSGSPSRAPWHSALLQGFADHPPRGR
ncbi:hypothetical protein GCM10018793_23740 [Streptomyces sulfonofaciens]|uniref:OmpR/PhoB-type domain-containing protein n=1 Tax=Streptomyces sulfonofaciens TaxID=68272 RepID=A0A919G3K3_9ACTN|nr:hypothetical protein GCM10018793_23740 [Streptomyces sulfonofaciens]